MVQIAWAGPLCAENVGLGDIARGRGGGGGLISRGELIMYCSIGEFFIMAGD